MANYRRPGYARIQKRRQMRIVLIIVAGCAAVAILLVALLLRPGRDGASNAAPTAAPTAAIAEETAVPSLSSTATPAPESPRAVNRPTASPGYLPVFRSAETAEKIICITVNDCSDAGVLGSILTEAEQAGAKLTLFPLGESVDGHPEVAAAILRAYGLGFEIENYFYSNGKYYQMSAEDMAEEINKSKLAVCSALGLNYQMRFMRTRGGDGRNDLRTHQYMAQIGYAGMAHWNTSGSGSTIDELKQSLAPGNIYLFQCKAADLEKLKTFIPYAISQGYTLVTYNEMFGYPAPETAPLAVPVSEMQAPAPEAYVYEYKDIEKGAYLWDVYLMQVRLRELGYMEVEATGYYGNLTYLGVGYFQKENGVEATGSATAETQRLLFSEQAKAAGEETRAAVAQYTQQANQ